MDEDVVGWTSRRIVVPIRLVEESDEPLISAKVCQEPGLNDVMTTES